MFLKLFIYGGARQLDVSSFIWLCHSLMLATPFHLPPCPRSLASKHTKASSAVGRTATLPGRQSTSMPLQNR
ncbi:hypothetical protein FB451DRAFT_1215906 [Mycena latifolia]|nr:hypothetical protein FB451DRAFT_1215906 [Mycena latifolia]